MTAPRAITADQPPQWQKITHANQPVFPCWLWSESRQRSIYFMRPPYGAYDSFHWWNPYASAVRLPNYPSLSPHALPEDEPGYTEDCRCSGVNQPTAPTETPEDCTIHGSITAPVPTCEPEYATCIRHTETGMEKNGVPIPIQSPAATPRTEGLRNKMLDFGEHTACDEYHALCVKLERELHAARAELAIRTGELRATCDKLDAARAEVEHTNQRFMDAGYEVVSLRVERDQLRAAIDAARAKSSPSIT